MRSDRVQQRAGWGWVLVLLLVQACASRPAVRPEAERKPLKAILYPASPEPGHALRLQVNPGMPATSIQAQGWGQTARLEPLPDNGVWEGYFALPLEIEPGTVGVTLTAVGRDGTGMRDILPVVVSPRSEPIKVVHLTIKGFGKYDFTPESRKMAAARQVSATAKANAPLRTFDLPVTGRRSETFGVKRVYNHGTGSWYHGGWDIAAPGGTIIRAPADGRVILAEPFTAHGNTLVIDHGFGVVTTYLHQSALLVSAGDDVQRGQPIGKVGSTGSSTGNHLHFQINIHGRISDPDDFINGKLWNKDLANILIQ